MNITDVNNDSGVYELPAEFLISLNSAELLSATFEFKIETFIMLL